VLGSVTAPTFSPDAFRCHDLLEAGMIELDDGRHAFLALPAGESEIRQDRSNQP